MQQAVSSALSQTWPSFALVAGLLLIGSVAASDGVFEVVGTRLARLPGGNLVLLCSLLALVAVVTAVLNLDTSVVFLTPIVLHAAWNRGVDDRAFLYGSVLMANSASLLLPGSNLTNLLVLGNQHASGLGFAGAMLPAWVASVLVTAAVLIGWRRRDLTRAESEVTRGRPFTATLRPGVGVVGIAVAAVLVLALSEPALPVLGVGIATAGCQVGLRRLKAATAARAVSAPLLLAVFVLAVGLGWIARVWGAPAELMQTLSAWQTAGLGAASSVILNNLPAAMLLASGASTHARALLIGLNLGPNLAVSGSLSAILWMRVARAVGARPSALTYTRLGLLLVPCSVAAALLALALFTPQGQI